MDDLDILWEPVRIGKITTKNRVYLPAHGTHYGSEQSGEFFRERARGGVGLIVVAGILVHQTSSFPGGYEPWRREWIPEAAKIFGPSRAEGCPIFSQLVHMGPGGPHRSDELWGAIWAPSAIPSPAYNVMTKAIDEGEIDELIDSFATSAAHVQEAGGDGVEIHAAHGYLLSAFLSPWWNRRDDKYGGNSENRARLIIEVGKAIRKRCGNDFVVGLKMNLEEHIGPRGTTPDEAMRSLAIFDQTELFDFFTLGHVDYHSTHHLMPPLSSGITEPPLASGARRAREIVKGRVPILMAGSMRDLAAGAKVVHRGDADMVGLVRPHLADPELILKQREGRANEIRRCVGANQGCWRRVYHQGLPISCTVNPTTGYEAKWGASSFKISESSRKILVVGGGPAGMKFAETAARRGHHVTLWEAASALGGQLNLAAKLPDFGHWHDLVEDLASSIKRLNVDIRLNTCATVDKVIDFEADLVIAATGSQWDVTGFSCYRTDRDEISRSPDANVLDPITVIADPFACGNQVVIIDDNGDYLPLGLARLLAATGKDVTIITSSPEIGDRIRPTLDLPWVYPRLLAAGVKIIKSSFVERIEADKIVTRGLWDHKPNTLSADTVVLCMTRHSNSELYQQLRARGIPTQRLGDSLAPREVDDAIFEGFRDAMAIA